MLFRIRFLRVDWILIQGRMSNIYVSSMYVSIYTALILYSRVVRLQVYVHTRTTTFVGHVNSPHEKTPKRHNANQKKTPSHVPKHDPDRVQKSLLIPRHTHISINRRTKGRKTRAPPSRGLRARLRTQNTTSNTPCGNTIREIILRP